MRGIRFLLVVGLACVYVVFLRGIFRSETAQASSAESIPVRDQIEAVYGNGGLTCLLIYKNGEVDMIDGGRAIDTRQIVPSKGASRFTLGALTPSGVAYLLDDVGSICRVTMRGDRAISKPIQTDGQVLAMAVQEKRGLLWLAVKRNEPHPDDLFVLTINLAKGKIINSANLEKQGNPTRFEPSANGEYVLLSTDASPGLYVFDYKDKQPFSKYVLLGDLVSSIAYDGDSPVLGLHLGSVVMLDPETWRVSRSVDSGQYAATAVAVGEGWVGVGHGGSNGVAETGSFQSIDSKNWETSDQCVARSVVTGAAFVHGEFVYGMDSGALDVLTKDGGCASLDIPKDNLPGAVRFMTSSGDVCLIVGDKAITRLMFR